jgi:hypothetical protein
MSSYPNYSSIARREDHGESIISLVSRPLRTRKGLTISGLWLFGLFALFLAPAPSKITPEKLQAYQSRLDDARGLMKNLHSAERQLMDAQLALKDVSAWFWRWRPEHREKVLAKRPAVYAAEERVRTLQRERDAILRDAKSALGLWSEAGLEESRELLWTNFHSGKVFAQRQTLFDSIFTLLDSREKDWFFVLIQILFTALVNYTIGTVISVITFVISLPSLLSSFAPSLPSALAFFSVSVLAACSLVVTYLALLYGAGAAVVATTAHFVVAQRQRIEAGGGRPAEQIRYTQRRSHYD